MILSIDVTENDVYLYSTNQNTGINFNLRVVCMYRVALSEASHTPLAVSPPGGTL